VAIGEEQQSASRDGTPSNGNSQSRILTVQEAPPQGYCPKYSFLKAERTDHHLGRVPLMTRTELQFVTRQRNTYKNTLAEHNVENKQELRLIEQTKQLQKHSRLRQISEQNNNK